MHNEIKPLGNNIMFIFVDDVRQGMFYDVEKSGIIIGKSYDGSAKEPRWGVVTAVGPDVDGIQPGQKILMEPLRWTEAMKVNNKSVWFTRESEIMCVAE